MTFVRVLSLFLTALATGVVFTHVLQALPRTELPGPEFLLVHKILMGYYGPVLAVVEVGALLTTGWIAWELRQRREAKLPQIVAVTCLLAMVLIWGVFISPINLRIETWSPDSLPPDWDLYRDRWTLWQVLRALLAFAAMAALVYSALRHRLPWPRRRGVVIPKP